MKSLNERLAFLAEEMHKFPDIVYVGFSGGKDSSAVVKLLLNAQRMLSGKTSRIEIVYCDTGVENPVVDRFVKSTLIKLEGEIQSSKLNAGVRIIRPLTAQSFFVRLIGRGYPPPTNSFRWCTTDIRIRPFQHFIRRQSENALIAVGTRMGESRQRDRSLKRSAVTPKQYSFYQKQRDGFPGATLFSPIIDFSVEDVWDALMELEFPKSIDIGILAKLYKDGGGECPVIRDFKDKPCSRARFGCWTCTVVRHDRSSENMIAQGYDELRPYFEFREWLTQMRNLPEYRCNRRRTGVLGPGPLTLSARKIALEKLKILEEVTGQKLITEDQEVEIERLWDLDRKDPHYQSLE